MQAKKKRFCRCGKCGYEWMQNSRTKNAPATCANEKCRSRLWNKVRYKKTA